MFSSKSFIVSGLAFRPLIHFEFTFVWEGLGQEENGTTEDEMAGWHH